MAAQERISPGDWVLFCLAGVLALAVFVIERTPTNVVVVLVGMFLLLIRPMTHLAWVRQASTLKTKLARQSLSILLAGVLVSVFGYVEWPAPTKRHLSTVQMRTMANVIEENKGTPVEIAAVANDNEAYDLAEQVVAVFNEGGWVVTPAVPPTIIAAGPIEDITVVYASTDDEKHILLLKAFKNVNIKAISTYDDTILKIDHVPIFISIGKFEKS